MKEVSPDESMKLALEALPRMPAPAGWEQKVLRQIDGKMEARGRRRWLWLTGGALVVAAAVGGYFLVSGAVVRDRGQLAMITEVVPSGDVVRAAAAKVGDTLRVSVTIGDARAWDVRLYQDRQLVASCGETARCTRDGQQALAEIPLTRAGSHRALLIVGEAIPLSRKDYDEDVTAAGVQTLTSSPLTVLPFARR